MNGIDLAAEMAAARLRRAATTAAKLKESRVHAIRTGLRPGATRQQVRERAQSFYPRLGPELLEEAIAEICGPEPVGDSSTTSD